MAPAARQCPERLSVGGERRRAWAGLASFPASVGRAGQQGPSVPQTPVVWGTVCEKGRAGRDSAALYLPKARRRVGKRPAPSRPKQLRAAASTGRELPSKQALAWLWDPRRRLARLVVNSGGRWGLPESLEKAAVRERLLGEGLARRRCHLK